MNRKNAVRLVSFCAAAVLAAAGFAVKSRLELERYRLEIQNTYSRSLDGLNSSVNNISLILEKAGYVTTAKQISNMAAQLLSEAESAKNSLSQLPSGQELTVLNRFLSQVGNYAMSVSKSLVENGSMSEEHTRTIEILRDTARKISKAVGDSAISYNNPSAWAEQMDKTLDGAVDTDSLAGALDTLETAALFTECDKEKLSFDGNVNGRIPAYRYVSEGVAAEVSCQGGYMVYMRKNREIGDYILEYSQALDKAKRYLEKTGMTGFTETYYFTDEGVCVINFAYLDGATICYTDLVKVGVAMDTGEIMLYEASGYLTNHTERAFETPAATAEQAREKVSGRLSIRETGLALIPTPSGGEVRCYEFVCEADDGQEILVYINASTLEEEDILILLKSDGGTLTK